MVSAGLSLRAGSERASERTNERTVSGLPEEGSGREGSGREERRPVTGGRERFEASRRGNFTGIYTPRPLRSAVHDLPSPVNAAPRIPRTALALAPSPSLSNHAAVCCKKKCCCACAAAPLAQAGVTRYASVREATVAKTFTDWDVPWAGSPGTTGDAMNWRVQRLGGGLVGQEHSLAVCLPAIGRPHFLQKNWEATQGQCQRRDCCGTICVSACCGRIYQCHGSCLIVIFLVLHGSIFQPFRVNLFVLA